MKHQKLPSGRKIRLDSTAALCMYTHYQCMNERLQGYEFCLNHILEDKTAPYKQCSYIYQTNGKRCLHVAPKTDKREGYCAEHAKRTTLLRQRASRPRKVPECPQTIVAGMNYYLKQQQPESGPSTEMTSEVPGTSGEQTVPADPFVDIDPSRIHNLGSKILDCASESDSESEVVTLGDTWQGQDDSDDSMETEQDPLRYAGTYTPEEIVSISRAKLIRLQTLYIEQLKFLNLRLRQNRRTYLAAVKDNDESIVNFLNLPKKTPGHRRVYEKFKALGRYHRSRGIEAVLAKQSCAWREKMTDENYKPPPRSKCAFVEGGVRCAEGVLPLSKYCLKHILKDRNQKLFAPCGYTMTDVKCLEPIPQLFETSYCVLHVQLHVPGQQKDQGHENAENVATSAQDGASNVADTEETEEVFNNPDFKVPDLPPPEEEFVGIISSQESSVSASSQSSGYHTASPSSQSADSGYGSSQASQSSQGSAN